MPRHHDLDELVGPFYDPKNLTQWLSLDPQSLDALVQAGALLSCPLADGTRVYPAWQFLPDGSVVPHLSEVIEILEGGAASQWTIATWLRTPVAEMEGRDAVSWLSQGRDPAAVLAAARVDASRWAH